MVEFVVLTKAHFTLMLTLYIYIYIYMYTHTHIYIYVHTHKHVYIYAPILKVVEFLCHKNVAGWLSLYGCST